MIISTYMLHRYLLQKQFIDWKIEIYCLAFLPINYFDIYCLILVYNYCFEVCFVCFCCVYFLKSHKSINRKWARISEANICNTILLHFFVYAVLMISRKKKKIQIKFLYFQKLIFICIYFAYTVHDFALM